MIHIVDHRRSGQLNIMSERQLYHDYCTDCWLETGEEILSYYTVCEVIFLPCFLFSLVSSWGSWVGGEQQRSLKAFSLNAKAMSFRLSSGTLPPLLCHIGNKCPPHRLCDGRT